MTGHLAVYLLNRSHADQLERLFGGPATTSGVQNPPPFAVGGAKEYVDRQLQGREEGKAYASVIMDRASVVGLCVLEDADGRSVGNLGCWIGDASRGKGYATFGVRMTLELAFKNLQVERVSSRVHTENPAGVRVLEKNGFARGDSAAAPDGQFVRYELTRIRWKELQHGPVVDRLPPALRDLLHAELAAGNDILESGTDWPEAGGGFVRLRQPFRARPSALPPGVSFEEPNDPHYWTAALYTTKPRFMISY